MGYPDDWRLAWYNGGTPISTQPSPTTVPTGTDDRFMFTSMLTYTPVRADNGDTIKCAAERGASSSPEGTLGPLNVQCKFI